MGCIDLNITVTVGIVSFIVGMTILPLFGYIMRKIPPPYMEETESLFHA
jgi:hypothetical protein